MAFSKFLGRSLCGAAFAIASATLPSGNAAAADITPPPMVAKAAASEPSGWSWQVTPYAWLISVDGSATIKGRHFDIDAPFTDLVRRRIPEDLFGLMGSFEARNGQVAIFGDAVYLKLGMSKDFMRHVAVDPEVGGELSADVSGKLETVIVETSVAYEFAHWNGSIPGSGTSLDIYGGGRFWWQKTEATLKIDDDIEVGDLSVHGEYAVARSGDITWFDPLVGLRLRHAFSPTANLTLRGDVGGFDIGSTLSWQAMGALDWQIGRSTHAVWNGMVGYRALHVDYEKGSGNSLFETDLLYHGPILGVTASF